MNLVLLVFIASAFIVAVHSKRAELPLTPMDVSTVTYPTGFNLVTTAEKDLLVYFDLTSSPNLVIRRRNSEGQYPIAANYTKTASYALTNGKWIALFPSSPGSISLFNINANNVLSAISWVNSTFGGYLLSDDTFVGAYIGGGNIRYRSHEYTASNNSWNVIPGTEVSVATSAQWVGDLSTYRVSDTHLIFIDYSSQDYHVAIYERQADRSWSFVESVPINTTYDPNSGSIYYNGLDTVVYSRPLQPINTNFLGLVFVYTKVDGTWIEQTFTVESVGYKEKGLLGAKVIFTDANTMYLSAGYENYDLGSLTAALAGGKILMLARNESSGLWEPAINLVGGDSGVFGLGFSINAYDILVPVIVSDTLVTSEGIEGNPVTFYSAPRCFRDAIDVTCQDQQVDDCSKFSTDLLYTINNPRCGEVTASITSLSLINNQAMNAQFMFTRAFTAPVYCNATVTCPAPPVQVSPIAQSSPSVTQIPVANSPGSTKISASTAVLQFNFLLLVILLIAISR